MFFSSANQAFVLQSCDRTLKTSPSGQVMLVSDRCYCIHQPETAIASLQRVLYKERSLFSLPKKRGAIPSGIAGLRPAMLLAHHATQALTLHADSSYVGNLDTKFNILEVLMKFWFPYLTAC